MIIINLEKNILDIKAQIGDNVKLVVVTKTIEDDIVSKLTLFGVKDIGENKVDQLLGRKNLYGDIYNYHMIGRLQTNKVKYLINWVNLIHSLDRLSLAKELEKQGAKHNFIFNCLIQLNISKEDSKTGIYLEDLDDFIEQIKDFKFINVRGFMTMAPFDVTDDILNDVFSKAKKTFDKYRQMGYNNFNIEYLSMGMSQDYKTAIENGSNMIRIGTKLFK